MSKPSWPSAYRRLAELLRDFYDEHKDISGLILFTLSQDRPDADELFPFLARFREQDEKRFLDPMNVFASFNGQHMSDKRRIACYNFWLSIVSEARGEKHKLLTNIDFSGCPTPRTSAIIVLRPPQAQLQIWRTFAQVVTLGVRGLFHGTFQQLTNWKGIGISALTMFFFWIDSDHFIALDNHSMALLRGEGYLKSRSVNYDTYLQLLNDTMGTDYVEQSLRAYGNSVITDAKGLRSTSSEFKIIGLRILEDTVEKWKRVLSTKHPYLFSKAYDISDPKYIGYDPMKDLRLFNLNDMTVSVSAIVGKNGSGKSSIVDIIYILLNNLSEQHPKISDKMEYVKGVYVDFYYATENVYHIAMRGEVIKINRYVPAQGGYAFDVEIPVERFSMEDLFYSVSLNYAHFALNSKHIGDWINYLFHKNDAYQQPLVLNPHRKEGNIDVNDEEAFANSRLLSNLLYYDESVIDDPKRRMFRELTDKQQAESIRLIIDQDKTRYLYMVDSPTKKDPERVLYGQWSESENYWQDFIKAINEEFKLPVQQVSGDPSFFLNWPDTAYRYILKKIISISFKYRKYKGQYVRTRKKFKNLGAFLQQLNQDDTHITFKLKQAINYLRHDHLRRFLEPKWRDGEGYMVPIEGLSKAIYEFTSATDGPKLVHMIPPSFMKPEIYLTGRVKLSDLSSGEKQRIFAVSTIAYHLINIDSANHDENQVSYKFANIIFDEIELYYHPEMQRTFVDYLLRYIGYLPIELAGVNITFVTHSPFILSDIPANNIVFLGEDRSGWNTFGANIHDMLADSFFLDEGVMGQYVKETVLSLTAYLNNKPKADGFAWTRETALEVIDIFGEPLIQKQLRALWLKKFDALNLHEQILTLRQQLKELENAQNSQQSPA
jgi:AAA15 family ATPase/GTPase